MGDFNELLINIVQRNEALYDLSCEDYHDNKMKKRIWIDIAEEISRETGQMLNADDVKSKWGYLRDRYKRLKKDLPSGSSAAKKIKWEFFESMMFLDACCEDRVTTSSLSSASASSLAETMSCASLAESSSSLACSDNEDLFGTEGESSRELVNRKRPTRLRSEQNERTLLLEMLKKTNEELASVQPASPNFHFGQEVATALDAMPEHERGKIKRAIMDLLYAPTSYEDDILAYYGN